MNMCTVCNSRLKSSINFAQTAPDEKLAFVERVCGILIESRFQAGHAAPWDMDICSSGSRTSIEQICAHHFCENGEGVIFDPVRFSLPPDTCAVKMAHAYFTTGMRRTAQSFIDRVPRATVRDPKLFATRSLLARGSPGSVRGFRDSAIMPTSPAKNPVAIAPGSDPDTAFRDTS